MITMSHIVKIRDLFMEGKTVSQIIEETGHDYKTVKKYIEKEDFSEVIPSGSDRPTLLDPYKEEITKLLENNKNSWYKQKLTAQRIKTLLEECHSEFNVSYNTVQRFVKDYHKKVKDGVGNGYSRLYWHVGEA